MAFTTLNTSEIESGKPVASSMLSKVKDNFDDHETRISAIEASSADDYPPLILGVGGPYYVGGAVNGVLKTTVNFPITITGVRLLIDVAGSSGTTEVDVKFSRSGGAYTSILTTKPSVGYASGNDAISSNGVVNATYKDLIAGDIIRLDLTSVQTGGRGFVVRIDFVRTA